MKKVEVLISAMHQPDTSIVENTNIQSDVVLINQCDIDEYKEISYENSTIKYLSTTERGLSKSRNKALELATGEICLICDDDEYLYNNYDKIIQRGYDEIPKADVIIFKIKHPSKKYWEKPKQIGYLEIPKIGSVQISFKRCKVLEKEILFNTKFGAGAMYSAGEENMFLYDCLSKGLKIYYIPIEIGSVKQEESTWFKGFNEKYFFDKGAWLSGCFPILKYVLIFYVVFRFRNLSEIKLRLTFKFLWDGMSAFKNKISFYDYYKDMN